MIVIVRILLEINIFFLISIILLFLTFPIKRLGNKTNVSTFLAFHVPLILALHISLDAFYNPVSITLRDLMQCRDFHTNQFY